MLRILIIFMMTIKILFANAASMTVLNAGGENNHSYLGFLLLLIIAGVYFMYLRNSKSKGKD